MNKKLPSLWIPNHLKKWSEEWKATVQVFAMRGKFLRRQTVE